MSEGDSEADVGVARATPTSRVPIVALVQEGSPRSGGVDLAHVQRLVDADGHLPPILVHGETMQVVDGLHRVAAALVSGHDTIEAHLLDGTRESAFILGVRANATHGLPLSFAERREAAAKILKFHGGCSDRMIASACGLSPKTIRDIRSANTPVDPLHKRVGKDGKSRPLDAKAGRRLAAKLILARPDASLREIASAAGVAPGTVRDVRARLARGEGPIPDQTRLGVRSNSDRPNAQGSAGPTAPADVKRVLEVLAKDPALRMKADGRDLLRWLLRHAVHPVDCARLTQRVPEHCIEHLAELARRCAGNWTLIAYQVDELREQVAARNGSPIANQTCQDERPA